MFNAFLCLVVSILNSEKKNKLTIHYLEKNEQRTTKKKINGNDLGNKLFEKENIYTIKVLAQR